jgi:predicted phage tail protein
MSGAILAETNRIVLHGRLQELFGGPFDLGVKSPAEAVHALCLCVRGFREAMAQGAYRVIYGRQDDGMELGEDQLRLQLGFGREVHFIPVAAGAGRVGTAIGKIVLGTVLIATAFLAPAGTFPIALGIGSMEITATAVAMFGFSMILNGLSSIFAPSPSNGNAKKKQESFLISGSVNSIGQGQPVPLCYGLVRAGSTVISLSYTVADISLNSRGGTRPGGGSTTGPFGGTGGGRAGGDAGMTSTGSTESVEGESVGGGEVSGTYIDPTTGSSGG